MKLAVVGSVLGVAGAYGVSRLLASAYPDMPANRFAVLISTTLLLFGIALLACWLPARKAGKVNPVDALRAE